MDQSELIRKLQYLDRPALPDPVRKQQFLDRLTARAWQEKRQNVRRRSSLLVALVVAVVGINSNAFTNRANYTFIHETSSTRTYMDPSRPDHSIGTTINDDADATAEARKFNEFFMQYMSGQSELVRINGHSIGNRTHLGTKHVAETRHGSVHVGFRLESTLPPIDHDLNKRFLDSQEFKDMLGAVYRHEATAFDDTVVVDGMQALTVQRYRFDSEEFGPVVIWLGRKDSNDGRGAEKG